MAEFASCGRELDEPEDLSADQRQPCPDCGSKARVKHAEVSLSATTGVEARADLIRAWDAASLTLFGVLYAILVTVSGVVVAMVGTGDSWHWWGIYAIVCLTLLGLSLFVFPQAVIASMRWLVGRAKKGVKWPR